MNKPDWKTAPERATHWDEMCNVFCLSVGWWGRADGDFVLEDHNDWGTARYIERPITTEQDQ